MILSPCHHPKDPSGPLTPRSRLGILGSIHGETAGLFARLLSCLANPNTIALRERVSTSGSKPRASATVCKRHPLTTLIGG